MPISKFPISRRECRTADSSNSQAGGLVFSGRHGDQPIMQILELPQSVHPYFIAAQFHPELTSRPLRPQPMFTGLVAAALAGKKR